LGGDRAHTEAKDKDDEECGDTCKGHMEAEPPRSSGAKVASCQEGDREREENCYAGESGWLWVINLLVRFMRQ
jgi:hypothetical protein